MSAGATAHTSSNGLSYISSGSADNGLTLLCVHGWSCRASDFTPLFQELSKEAPGIRATAVDLPGHGNTPKEVCPVATISTFAEAILGLADELSLSNVVLVGHSMGCRVALDAWNQAQATGKPNIKALVFLDGSHYKLRPSLFAFDSGDARSKGMTDEEKSAKKAEMFQRMFSARTPQEFQSSALAHIKAMDKGYGNAIRESHIRYDNTEMDDALARFGGSGTPLLNLQSTDVDADNQRISLQAGEMSKWMRFIQGKVPQEQQRVVEDSAHFPHVDRPDVVAGALLEFIQGQHIIDGL